MKDEPKLSPHRLGLTELESLREIRVFLLAMGIALILLGAAVIGSSFIATLATAQVFGILLLVGAIFQVVTALWGRSWKGFFLHLLTGVLYLVVGVFTMENPFEAAMALSLLVAASLLVGGVLRIIVSAIERFDGWGWALLNGIVSALLGTAIWRQWPLSGFWVIGLFVGVEMLLSGLSWVMLGLNLRPTSRVAFRN